MTRRLRSYESDDLIVDYDAKRCIHAEECVHGLPGVFEASRRPWIDPTGAPAADLVRVIERCPTGALQYRWQEGGPEEKPPSTNTVRVSANGPLYLRGRLRIALPGGETIDETRAALCRCGHSKDKPFCDNAHLEAEFSDDGAMTETRLKPGDQTEGGALEISLVPNGPILVRGPCEIRGTGGESAEGVSGALCRCGGSAAKPFCDSTHKSIGFEAE